MQQDVNDGKNHPYKDNATHNPNPFQHRVDYKYDDPILLQIAERQKELGWSDYMLAKMTGVPEATTRSARRNNNTPSMRNLVKYAIGMKLPPYAFFPKSAGILENIPAIDRRMMEWWYNLSSEEKAVFDKAVNFHQPKNLYEEQDIKPERKKRTNRKKEN